MDPKTFREQAVREAKVTLIFDAARKIFSEKGFFEARLDDIAAAAGFSKASLYTYYTDKEEIFLSLAIKDLENLFHRLEATANPNVSFLENLEAMLNTIFAFFGENFGILLSISNFQTMCKYHQERMSEKHKQLFAELPAKFNHIIEQQVALIKAARERKELCSPIDDLQLANYMSALVRGIIFQWQLRGKMGDAKKEIEQLTKFLANGLCCRLSETTVL